MTVSLSNKKAWGSKLQSLSRSNNGLFVLVVLLAISNVIAWGAYIKASQRYIIVGVPPHVSAPFKVTDSGVDASYLKQMSLFYIDTRLNFNEGMIAGADQILLENTDSRYYAALKSQLLQEQTYIKDHKISSYFVPTIIKTDPIDLNVLVEGILERWVGLESIGKENKTYRLQFSYDDGRLKIKSFQEVTS